MAQLDSPALDDVQIEELEVPPGAATLKSPCRAKATSRG